MLTTSRKMSWVEYVAKMRFIKGSQQILVGRSRFKSELNIEMDLKGIKYVNMD
jgi:hypothetical protein